MFLQSKGFCSLYLIEATLSGLSVSLMLQLFLFLFLLLHYLKCKGCQNISVFFAT